MTVWDKVVASAPVDRVAVWVTRFKAWDGPRERTEGTTARVPGEAPQRVLGAMAAEASAERRWRWLIRNSPHRIRDRPSLPDLTGRAFGNLLVLGMATARPGRAKSCRSRGGHWVCVCSCGAYVLRRRRTIEAGNAGGCGPGCDDSYLVAVVGHMRAG